MISYNCKICKQKIIKKVSNNNQISNNNQKIKILDLSNSFFVISDANYDCKKNDTSFSATNVFNTEKHKKDIIDECEKLMNVISETSDNFYDDLIENYDIAKFIHDAEKLCENELKFKINEMVELDNFKLEIPNEIKTTENSNKLIKEFDKCIDELSQLYNQKLAKLKDIEDDAEDYDTMCDFYNHLKKVNKKL